jgi:hydrogenase/urease accessory protein HupE
LLTSQKTLTNFLKVRHLTLVLSLFLLFSWVLKPVPASAHSYSASYTQITIDKNHTKVIFSLDVLSIFEIIKGIDKNNNWKLEKSEIKANKHKLEEILSEGIAVDKDNRELTPKVGEMKVVKKQGKDYLSIYITYDGFKPGETISFNDGFYTQDSTANYVNLISANFFGATSENVLQGTNRDWTMIIPDPQQDQQTQGSGGQTNQTDTAQQQPAKTTENSFHTTSTSPWFAFFKLGMLHILTGYDHLLFLFSLLLGRQTLKQYAAVVTSFTIAHCITLSLSVLGIVTIPSRFVEAAIAFSICYVALENLFRKKIKNRWMITFVFGLIHGLGFATLLRDMQIPKTNLAIALLNFNLGIEVIQLSIVLILLPVLAFIFKQKFNKKFVQIGSIILTVLGAFWFIQRLIF